MRALRTVGLFLLVLAFITNTTLAQRRRAATQRTPAAPPPVHPAVTFDNLLAADSFKIYFEVRAVGQLLRSQSFNDIIDPIMKLVGPPQGFKTLMKWLNSESDALMTSRMLVASWPSRPKLPNVLFAIEFASAEDAQKFEPRLKAFLPRFLPTPTPEVTLRPDDGTKSDKNQPRVIEPGEDQDAKPKKILPPYVVKQAGALIFISDASFSFKNLRPPGSKLFTEDQNFRRVHERFVTESVLLYVDSGALEREEQDRRRQYEDEEQKQKEAEAANPPKAEAEETTAEVAVDAGIESSAVTVSPPPAPDVIPQTQTETAAATLKVADGGSETSPPGPDVTAQVFGSLASVIFGGRPIWPGAVGVALAFEPDSYSLRVLLVNEPGVRANAIPFMPQLVSGPPLTPESPSVFPADTEFFVALSLDYPQIYEGMVNRLSQEAASAGMAVTARDVSTPSPFAAYERHAGFKIKDDLIPLLGNEIALSLPMKSLDVGPGQPTNPQPQQSAEADPTHKGATPQTPSPVIAISIKDREGVRLMIPKLIDLFGLKGASLLAQTEKRGDTEVVTYANAFSYAFVDNFLLVSPDPKALRHVVDSYLNHETLASDSHFRNYTRWQSRQLLGQFYVSPALMDSYSAFARTLDSPIADQLRDLLSRLSPTAEPVTYALSNEGQGPLHELRVPKNLALLIAGMSGSNSQASGPQVNESIVKGSLRTIASAQMSYKATTGDGSYGSKDQLIANGLVAKNVFEPQGYRIELSVGGSGFEAHATPLEYGKTGKLSFFVDESGVIRGGDHGGGPATIADEPLK